MKKEYTKLAVVLGILLGLLNIVVFVISSTKTIAFWISYAFTLVSFVSQIIIWHVSSLCDKPSKDNFLGFPAICVGIVYLIVQTVTLVVFLFFPILPVWSAVVVCSTIAGITAIAVIAANAGRSKIEHTEINTNRKISFIKKLQTEVELLAEIETNAATKSALTQLADKIRFSDPVSNETLTDLENQITAKVIELKDHTDKTKLIAQLNSLFDERNRKCKLLK